MLKHALKWQMCFCHCCGGISLRVYDFRSVSATYQTGLAGKNNCTIRKETLGITLQFKGLKWVSEGEETKGLAFTTVCWPIASRDGCVRNNKTKYSGNQAKDSSRPVRTCEVIENSTSFNVAFYFKYES